MKVLLVEDDEATADYVSGGLKEHGHVVDRAANGRDGLFLESVFDRAAKAGVQDKLRVRIDLQTQTFRGMKATNGVAVIPGRSFKSALFTSTTQV